MLKRNALIVSAIVLAILALDQIIKVYVRTHFAPYEEYPLIGDWFSAQYIENQGMAFGTTFGSKMWHKLALSIFRIIAISAIVYYWIKQAKKGARLEFLIAVGMIMAGATGNLIDSMFYDFIFPHDPCIQYNFLAGSGNVHDCGLWGEVETRHTGFLLGNVVDMFQFTGTWPDWMPGLAGKQIFPAIWNTADASISIGVVMVFLRQRTYFPRKKKVAVEDAGDTSSTEAISE